MGLITKTVMVKWNVRNKQWYESKEYIFTKWKDEFEVKVEDLTSGSTSYVDVKCDCEYCKSPYLKPMMYKDYIRSVFEDGRYCCRKCLDDIKAIKLGKKIKVGNEIVLVNKPKITNKTGKNKIPHKKRFLEILGVDDYDSIRNYLFNEYVINIKSAKKISDEIKIPEKTIVRLIHRYNIPINKPSDYDLGMKGKNHSEETRQKMRDNSPKYRPWMIGKIWTDERREKTLRTRKETEFLIGNKNGNWKGGVSYIHNIIRCRDEYKQWRFNVMERDNFTCQFIGGKRNLQVHHLWELADIVQEARDKLGDINDNREEIIQYVLSKHTLDIGITVNKDYHSNVIHDNKDRSKRQKTYRYKNKNKKEVV